MQVKNPGQGLFTISETDEPLRAGIPALWHHSSTRETSLQVTSNARLERRTDRDKGKQETLCLWLNSTLGLLMRILHGNRPYPGRSSVPHELIRTMPALDVNRLSAEQLAAASEIYEDLKDKTLQGFTHIQDDPVRNELNIRLCKEVLDIDENRVETLTDNIREPGYEAENVEELVTELTYKLALEPTMHARH